MKKKQFTESQIAFALRQAESGTPLAEIIRKVGIARTKRHMATDSVGLLPAILISCLASW